MADKKILVVDDEPHVVRTLALFLKKEGYKVASAGNGEEALNLVHEYKPDLMLLDAMMPKKNGYEVCEEIRSDSALRDIHIIIVSARGQEADREKAISLGADEFITKPFSLAGIIRRAKEILN
ncbi:MAG: response regulator [Dehalococcoidia bacterium]|jgi:two-component system alkaline phosphatase synthesis response regulator PhoP